MWRQQYSYRGCHSACFSQGKSVLLIHAGRAPLVFTSGTVWSICEINNTNVISTTLPGICSFHGDLPRWFPVHKPSQHKSSANAVDNMVSLARWRLIEFLLFKHTENSGMWTASRKNGAGLVNITIGSHCFPSSFWEGWNEITFIPACFEATEDVFSISSFAF